MRVGISQRQLSLSERLAGELNRLSKNFSAGRYHRIENIDRMLLKRDVSVEEKKRLLMRKLHSLVAETLSINRQKASAGVFKSMKKRLHNIRKIVDKLRSVNYYLETTFMDDLRVLKIKVHNKKMKMLKKNGITGSELEALEYTAYKLMGDVVMLDKQLLKGYSLRQKIVAVREKTDFRELGVVLAKESSALEHLEAKLPPAKHATASLLKEPVFTHWVSRVFALLAYLEHLYSIETVIFSKLKKNRLARMRISRKILQLAGERMKLLRMMDEKASSIKKSGMGEEIRKGFRSLTATINL